MQVNIQNQGNYVELQVSGRIDASTVGEFEVQALGAAQDSTLPLLVNFAQVEYMSSAGLRAILKLAKLCQSKKLKLACYAMQTSVFEVFRISGFSSIISICDTLEQALQKIA